MNEKNQTILIQITDGETIATRIPTGWPGDAMTRARTKRHPKDRFDAYIAARVALDRVFRQDDDRVFRERAKEDVPELETPRWKVGDWVVAIDNPIYCDYFGCVGQVTSVERFCDHCEYAAEFIDPLGTRIPQYWCSFDNAVRAATETEIKHANPPVEKEKFQAGDIVRVVNPIPPTCYDYELGDVAVVMEEQTPTFMHNDEIYRIRVRSKEHKGKVAWVLGRELQLLHRDGKKEGAQK